ncbi:hypothetical protein V6Z11_A10G114100 [Gossypium hirsutum]
MRNKKTYIENKQIINEKINRHMPKPKRHRAKKISAKLSSNLAKPKSERSKGRNLKALNIITEIRKNLFQNQSIL